MLLELLHEDVAMAACARRHGAGLESADRDFELLADISAICIARAFGLSSVPMVIFTSGSYRE